MGKGVSFIKEHKFLKTACFYNVKADEVYYFEFQRKHESNKISLGTVRKSVKTGSDELAFFRTFPGN
jgi:hypothetical protein